MDRHYSHQDQVRAEELGVERAFGSLEMVGKFFRRHQSCFVQAEEHLIRKLAPEEDLHDFHRLGGHEISGQFRLEDQVERFQLSPMQVVKFLTFLLEH